MSFLSKWRWELCSPIAGLMLTLAFSPFNYVFLVFISLGFVFYSWLNVSPLVAALRGYLYGVGLFASGISWVYISIHDYGGAPALGAVLLTLLVVCFWSIFPAITAYISVKLVRNKYQEKLIWLIPVVWIVIEYFRGYWLLNGFPWLQIAYTQLDTPLKGFIPIVGVYGTGFLLALSISIVISAYKKTLKFGYASLFIVLLFGVGFFLQTINWTNSIGKPIKVALIQGNIPQDQKWLPENRIKTLIHYKNTTAKNWDADIIIWPETAIPAYLSQVKEFYLKPLSKDAKENNTDLIVSLPATGQKNEYFNTVLTLGRHEGRYDKNHLLPFGEYLPLQPVSGFILKSLGIHLGDFTSGGDKQTLLKAGGYPFATSICYEDAFGEEAIRAMPQAAFLVNVTNDAWFGDSIEPYQHMQIAQMRALETGRFLLRATNTGMTAIVSPDGLIVKQAPLFQQTVLKGEITPMGGMTPYAWVGDKVIIIILVMALLAMLLPVFNSRQLD